MEVPFRILILFINEYVHTFTFGKCIDEKIKFNAKNIIAFILYLVINYFNNLYNFAELKLVTNLLLFIILFYVVFKKDLKTTITITLVVSIISIIIEFALSFLTGIFVKNIGELNQMFWLKDIFSITMYFVIFGLFNWSLFVKIAKKVIFFLDKILNIEVIFIFTIIIFNLILVNFNNNYRNGSNNLYNILILIVLSILIVFTLKAIYKKEIYKIKVDSIQDKLEKYDLMVADYRELKHNLNNDLLSIRSIGTKKVQDLVDTKIKKYNKEYAWISNIEDAPKGIQGLIYFKLKDKKGEKLYIQVNNKINYDITEKIPVKQYSDLCDILGIVLDNAIEAAKNSAEKVIYIQIYDQDEITIDVTNTFKNDIDLNSIGKKYYSTKKTKSGIGLNYISKIKNRKIVIKKEIINNLFKVKISFKY